MQNLLAVAYHPRSEKMNIIREDELFRGREKKYEPSGCEKEGEIEKKKKEY